MCVLGRIYDVGILPILAKGCCNKKRGRAKVHSHDYGGTAAGYNSMIT